MCGAVGVWRGQMEAIVEDIRTPSATAPAARSRSRRRRKGGPALVRAGLERAVQATETVVEAIDALGSAGHRERERSPRSRSRAGRTAPSTTSKQAEDSLDDEAETLEESVEQLTRRPRRDRDGDRVGAQTIADIAVTDPELADALRDSSTCQQLREEAGEQ